MSLVRLGIMGAAVVMACCLAGWALWFSGNDHTGWQAAGEPPAQAGAARSGGIGVEKANGGIAWGEPVDGLQLGLQVADDGPAARLGGSVNFVIRCDNSRPAGEAGLPRRLVLHVPAGCGRWRW